MRVLKAAGGEVLDLAFSPDGRAVAAVVGYHGVFLWNLDAPVPSPVRLEMPDVYRGGLAFSPDGRSVGWLSGHTRQVYDRDARQTATAFAVGRQINGLVRSADGTRFVSRHGMPDHRLIGWRPVGGEWVQAWALSTADLSAESLTLSADGRLLGMLTRTTLVREWWKEPARIEVRDAATGAVRGVGGYPYGLAAPLLFSPDGRQLAGFHHMTLLVWPVPETGSLGSPRLVHNDSRKHFTAAAYHPAGRHLYATSNDTTVHVFDAATWQRVTRFTWQLGRLKAVAVSPDGTLAAAGGDRGEIVIWDVDV